MNTFKIGDGVRQKSTGGTGGITGIHPVLPLTTGKTIYTVRFNFGQPTSKVPEEDLELFVERRSGNERRNVQDRRRLVIVKLQGQCVLECLAKILGPSVDVRKMFDESISGQRDPSNMNDVKDVLMENGYIVGLVNWQGW